MKMGSFSLAWQPIVETKSLKVKGFECLLRPHALGTDAGATDLSVASKWVEGVVQEAESLGPQGASDLDASVIARFFDEARSLNERLSERGVNAFFCVNVSPWSLVDSGRRCLGLVEETLRNDPALPEIHLEIRETVISDDMAKEFADQLAELSKLNLALSLDDFGSLGAGVQRLMSGEFSILKMDKQIMSTLAAKDYGSQALAHLVNLAHTLHMQAVAEGIESESHYRMAAEAGFDYAQGFWIARPLSAREVVEFVHDGSIHDKNNGRFRYVAAG